MKAPSPVTSLNGPAYCRDVSFLEMKSQTSHSHVTSCTVCQPPSAGSRDRGCVPRSIIPPDDDSEMTQMSHWALAQGVVSELVFSSDVSSTFCFQNPVRGSACCLPPRNTDTTITTGSLYQMRGGWGRGTGGRRSAWMDGDSIDVLQPLATSMLSMLKAEVVCMISL